MIASSNSLLSGLLAAASPLFMPHGFCYRWNPTVLWLNVVSDTLIALSYYCIPVVLIYFIRRNQDLPMNTVFWMFATFILACGTVHLLEVWNIWHANYLPSGVAKGVTAIVSVITAAMLVPLAPKLISVPERMQLQDTNLDLREQIAERMRVERALRVAQDSISGIIASAMDSIITIDEDQNILLFNAAAEKMFGCPASHVLGQSIERFIPQRFRAGHAGHVRQFGQTGVTSRTMGELRPLWAQRADGEQFQIEASISQGESAGKKIFTVILRDVTERVQATAARDRLAAVVDSTDDAIISKTLDGMITSWNKGAERLFGYRAEEVLGKPMLLLFPPHLVQEESEIMAQIGRGESVEHYETVRERKDGRIIEVSVTISPLRDRAGTIIGASKVARDVTERKHAEERRAQLVQELAHRAEDLAASRGALETQTRMLRLVLESMGEGLVAADGEGHFLLWNDSGKKILGRGPEKLTAEQWSSYYGCFDLDGVTPVPTDRLPLVRAMHGESLQTQLIIRHPESESDVFVEFTGRPLKDDAGNLCGGVVAFRDVTERVRAESELSRQAEELALSRQSLQTQSALMQSVLDNMGEGLVAANEHGEFFLWNPAAERIVGMGPATVPWEKWTEHYGTYLPDMTTPFPPAQNPLARAIKGEIASAQLYIRNPHLPQGAWVEANARPLRDVHGVVCGGVVAFRDITERKAAEEEILTLNRTLEQRVLERTTQLQGANQELEAFTYSVSHDLRAPLRHIAGFTTLLLEEAGSQLDAQAQRHLRRIHEGTRTMGQLVDELLSLARIGRQATNPQVVALNAMVGEVTDLLRPDWEGRAVEWKVDSLPSLVCDPTLMKQVFQNLLSNALKYSRRRDHAVIEVGATEVNGEAAIFVRDNGVGFNMKYSDKLFGVFQRLHRADEFEGTGVGLAIVQRIIKKHGGRVWAEGEIDKGATFYFTVAAAAATCTDLKSIAATSGPGV